MRAKELLFAAARRGGAFERTGDSRWRARRLLILCYHGVSIADEHEWNGELYVSPALLRRRLQYLRGHQYQILPLREACRRLSDGTLPTRSVALTFDDGAADFATAALPILEEFNAPATVYLTTYYCDVRLPVFDVVLSYVLWRGRQSRVDLAPLCEHRDPVWAQTAAEQATAARLIRDYALARDFDARAKDALVADVATMIGICYSEILASGVLQIMTPEAVASLPRGLVDVQLHTHRHRTPRNHALFLRELHENAARIRALRGDDVPLDHFCYPGGCYERDFLPWLSEAGIAYATTTRPGLASPGDNPLLLPRFVDTMVCSELAFEAWASGFAAWLPKRAGRHYRSAAPAQPLGDSFPPGDELQLVAH